MQKLLENSKQFSRVLFQAKKLVISLSARGGVAWTTTDKASLAFEEALPDDDVDNVIDDDNVNDDDDGGGDDQSTDGSDFSETKQQLVDQVT